MNKLDQIRKMTTVVADTGDINSIKQYTPTDATTNPSLLYNAAQQPQYQHLLKDAVQFAKQKGGSDAQQMELTLDKVAVNFAKEILNIIPGRVSIEVDARLSFDTQGTVARANRLIEFCKDVGINQQRILIKIASTWEGIRAGEQLEKQGIHCNLTLMFHIAQAVACAEAGITLISPFVGRILDWHKKSEGKDSYAPQDDPGVKSVTEIYNYFKKFGHKTVVMGASFRNTDEIMELAGCDLLTIAPKLMSEMQGIEGNVVRKLIPENASKHPVQKIDVSEANFRWLMNESPMATEKLAEGIRGFTADLIKLEKLLSDQANSLAA